MEGSSDRAPSSLRGNDYPYETDVPRAERGRKPIESTIERQMSNLVSIIVLASPIVTHPLINVIRATLESLPRLQPPKGVSVIISHDQPRVTATDSADYSSVSDNVKDTIKLENYGIYLTRLARYLDDYRDRTGYNVTVVGRREPGHIAGNLATALSHVHTPYVLQLQADVSVWRNVSLMHIVHDMMRNVDQMHFVRFNHRRNILTLCDRGFGRHANLSFARSVFVRYRKWYTRTVCFADQAWVSSRQYMVERVLPIVLKHAFRKDPETCMQPLVAKDPWRWGTFLYGREGEQPVVRHQDARKLKLHGEEKRVVLDEGLQQQATVGAFVCGALGSNACMGYPRAYLYRTTE